MPSRTSQKLKLYGVRLKMIGYFLLGVFGPIDVGGHAHAVFHGHHDLAVDDGDVFEFLLDGLTLFNEGFGLLGRQRSATLLG